MSPRITVAVAGRVLTQLRRDHRTLAMLLVLPCLLISLLWWMFEELPGDGFDRFGPALLAMFPFIVMFLVTSVTTLRERSSGTLERLLAMPMGKLDFLLGYALAFGLVAAVQSVLAVGAQRRAARPRRRGPGLAARPWSRSPTPCSAPRSGCSSARSRSTEFQAVQFMPAARDPADPAVRPVRPARRSCPTCSRRSATCCRCPTPSTR